MPAVAAPPFNVWAARKMASRASPPSLPSRVTSSSSIVSTCSVASCKKSSISSGVSSKVDIGRRLLLHPGQFVPLPHGQHLVQVEDDDKLLVQPRYADDVLA